MELVPKTLEIRGFLIKIHEKSAYLKHLEDFAQMSLTSFYQLHDAEFPRTKNHITRGLTVLLAQEVMEQVHRSAGKADLKVS